MLQYRLYFMSWGFWPQDKWNLSSLSRDQTCTSCVERSLQPLDCPGSLHVVCKGFYLFIHFWLCWVFVGDLGLFSSCSKPGPLLSSGLWASHCGGFSCRGPWTLGRAGFSTCVEGAQLLLSTCVPAGPEVEPMCPALEGEVSTTGLPGKPHSCFSPVQFSRAVVSESLRPRGPQHTRPPCPSPTPGVYSNSWCPFLFRCIVFLSFFFFIYFY